VISCRESWGRENNKNDRVCADKVSRWRQLVGKKGIRLRGGAGRRGLSTGKNDG